MIDKDFKYDVAFSFLKEDEELATKINDLIQGRVSTFLYSKRQGEIAGTDGEKTFNQVFGTDARTVVVLYRANWGKTPWTRIEETAIRNRAYEDGYDFAVFIPLDTPPASPKWLPKTQIWVGLERWGSEGAASVIESRVQQAGGTTHPETIEERAARLQREIDSETERQRFLTSEIGVKAAKAEINSLYNRIEALAQDLSKGSRFAFNIRCQEDNCTINSQDLRIILEWRSAFVNTLDKSSLSLELWKGSLEMAHTRIRELRPQKIDSKIFKFDVDHYRKPGWREGNVTRLISTDELAELCLRILIDRIHKDYVGRRV